jgi:hypothetical protein
MQIQMPPPPAPRTRGAQEGMSPGAMAKAGTRAR